MSSRNYETQILDSIQMIVDNAISKAEFDKTIKAIVSEVSNAAEGKYIVKYQGNSMVVYSSNPETRYTIGAEVYVLIPGNDMHQKKTIVGAVDSLGLDFISLVEGDAGYEVNGTNIVNSDKIFELCSYIPNIKKVLYDRDNNINLINVNTQSFDIYTKSSDYLICGATFRTALPQEQQIQGRYGIAFDIDYQDDEEVITRTYIVDTDDMVGMPYNLLTDTRQYAVFKIANQNILSVKQIYIFSYNFPLNEEGQPNDIFISNIELKAANELTKDELSSTILTLTTKEGTYFDKTYLDTDSLNIEAQIKIKGRVLGAEADIKYYWFREDNQITSDHVLYNRIGGAGWRCLNQYNPYDNEKQNIEWVSAKNTFNTMKKDNIAKETHYKCVAIYGNVTVQKEFTITNFDSIYEITIQSDEGAQFYHDNGKPSLTCLINGKEETSDEYTYIWSKIDSNNRFSMLSETTDANIAYNAAVATKEQLLAEIAAESKLTGEIQETLNECNATIEYYDSRTRIEQNKVHNINLKEITSYAIYKCAVFRHDVSLGVTTFKIVNDLTTNISYNLVINNGNQVFKYNEAGVAPNSSSAIEPVDILPLTFTLYDKDGKEVDKSLIGLSNISWKAPLQHTMIEETDLYEIKEETDDYVEYYKTQTFDFNIRPSYVSTHKNNNIQLIVKYKDNIITATTDFTFIKTGEAGTNGTEYICKILPNSIDVQDICPIVTYDTLSEEYSLNYRTVEDGQWFKINFWKNGELIYSNTSSGYTKEGQAIQLEWSILANNYGNDFQDNSNFNIDKETGIVSFNKENYDHPANIIKCKITYNNLEYFAIMPIILVRTTNDKYQISLENKTGFQEAMYTANGTNPVYNESKPFTIQVLEHINGNWEDVSLLEQNYAVDYDWSVKGQVYYSYWHSEQNLLEKSMYLLQEQRNQKYFEPADTFNGLCVNNAVECVISREEETLGSIHIPVYLYLNRYGNSAINGWDGNSISIDENNSGMILAPQVGAGKKNADNSFTGIFMGSVKEQGAPTEEHGLFGYNAGQRTIALNAEDGSARFGATGKGQIIIDPSTGNAMIESGNFNTEAGTGMRIDLSEPSIEFGSGNFKVDKYGQLTAAGFSTIDYVNKKKDEIIQEVEGMLDQSPLSVVLSTENLFVPCDDENVPVNAATYNVDFAGTFEGESIEPGQLEVLYAGKDDDNTDGFPVVVDSVTVTLTNNSDKQQLHFAVQNEGIIDDIALATNTYFRFNFFYTNGEQTHTITKTISMTVLPPGAPGKSAYDIWLDQGNVGTEEDYLNSLKGQSAQLSSFETERTISGYGTQLLGNSGNHEIPILTLYGNAEQDVEYTKNLLKGFQEPVSNTYYWSFGSNLQVENLENGWGRIILDNSAGTSTLTNGFQMGLNNLINWKYKTKYTVIVEIRNSSMTSNSSVFYPIGNGGSAVHCFDDDSWRLTNTQINNGGVYSWKGTTIDSGYSWEYLRGSLSAAPGAISTIEIRYSMYEGDFELGDTFEYIPCQCLYPTIDNPKIIKTASYTNIFDSEKWYQECFSIDSSSISKVTVDNREAYKVRPSGLVDFLFMENEFEEKTQYHLSFEGRQVSTSGTTMRVEFRYTDGTISSVNVPTSKTTFSTVSISSTAGKTIQGIGINSNEDKLSTFVYIRYFLLTKGPGKKDYLPYNQNVLSIITNVRNIVNIYELIPDVRINGKTGEEMSYGGYVVSPFIKLENIASFSKSYLLHNFAYYDQNFKYLGYGEQLLKDTAYIPASNKTSNNIIPYHLNPNITYVRVAYTGNGVTAATTWLKEALAANSLNHSSLTIRAQTTSTGITTGSDTGGVKATKHAIQLNQPFARVANPIERKPSVARDTVTIEDEIAQISYATKFIKWDGLEDNWEVYYETDDYMAFAMADSEISTDTTYRRMRSSHFEPGYKIWDPEVKDQPIEALWTLTGYIGVQILKSRLTENTIEGWKSWLTQNPITIIADRQTNVTSIDSKLYFLELKKPIAYLHTDYNDAKPELSGLYYTSVKGDSGDSIICKITPSAQMFKSADGPNGLFSPQEIYLFPEIFNTHFKEWLYSTDSMTWYPVVSGEHGLEIGTFSEKENTLKISNDSDLYTEEDLTVSFKCTTYMDQIYDVATIAKSYEIVDLTVGGRNFILKSHIFDDLKEWGEESVTSTNADGTKTTWYLTRVIENDVQKFDGQPASNISVSVGENVAKEQYVQIDAAENNGGRVHWIHSNTADIYLQDGDQFVFSCEIEGTGLSSNNPPLFHYHGTVGYLTMDGQVTGEPSRITCSGTWKVVEGYNTDFRFDFTGLVGTYKLGKFKLEKGKNPTDWTLAPEDLETIAELEYCIGPSQKDPPAEDDPSWGSQTLYKPNLADGDYLWSRIKNISTSGLITYNSYSCLLTFQKELKSQRTEYLLCNLVNENDVIAEENSEAWTTTKPTDFIREGSSVIASKLWSRLHLIYSAIVDGIPQEVDDYTNYTLDTSWEQSLYTESELLSKIQNILANTDEGFVRISGGNIVVGNDAKDPEHLIILNHYGISFMNREGKTGWPEPAEIEKATENTTAWTIDGSLDMNYIRTEELEATYIRNENLVLGNKDNRIINDQFETVDAGDLDIYDKDGHLIFETVTSAKTGSSDTAVWIEGFKIHQYVVSDDLNSWSNTGYIYLSSENGFGEFDINNKILFGNQNGVWYSRVSETEKQIIATGTGTNKYGIQMIPMNFTENGITHKGLAFIKVDAE